MQETEAAKNAMQIDSLGVFLTASAMLNVVPKISTVKDRTEGGIIGFPNLHSQGGALLLHAYDEHGSASAL